MRTENTSLNLKGAPNWITQDLIHETIRVWQPYYAESLTVEEALGIIMNVGQLVTRISGASENETVRRSRPGQQS